MNKLLRKLAATFLGFAMAAGVGVAVSSNQKVDSVDAGEEVYKSMSFVAANTSNSISSYTASGTYTANNFSVNIQNFSNNQKKWSNIRCGRKSNDSVATITTAAVIDTAITKVEITIDAIDANYVNSIKLYSKTSSASSWTAESTQFTKQTGAQSVSLSSPAANLLYKVEFDCTAQGSNGFVQISQIKYYYQNAGPSLSVSPTSALISKNGTQTLTAQASGGSGSVSWVTSDSDIVSISSASGSSIVATGEGRGTAIVTASYSTASDVEVSFQVTDVQHAGTEGDPYTVEDARDQIDLNTGLTNVYATGIVSGIVTPFNSQYGNISYNISTDGETSSEQLQAYRGKSYAGAAFESADDIQVGDEVVVYGTLKKHNSTYEFDADNQLVSLNRPVPATFDITATITDGTSDAPATIQENGNVDITITPDSGHKLPTSVSVTGASYTYSNGVISLSDPTDDVVITATCPAATSYSITITNTNCTYSGDSSIYEDGTATITFTPSSGYELPSSITPSGADVKSWSKSTGVLVLENPTAAVTITVTATVVSYDNTTQLTPGNYYIKYGSNYLSNVTSGHGDTTTTKNDALVFTFSLVGDDSWEIKNGDNYLGIGSGSTSLTLDSTQSQLSILWETEASGTRIIRGSSGRDLAWYASSSQIRTYSGKTDGTNGMTLESAKTVSGFSVYSTGADKNVLKGSTFDAAAAAAAGFQARLNYTDSTYDDVTSAATWTLDTSTTGTKTLTVSYLTYTDTSITDMNVYVVTIKTLSVNASDAKTSYVEGEQLNTVGLVITGYEQDSTAHALAISDCSFSPANGATLATSDTTVTVTYTNEDSTTATTTYSITVAAFVGYTKVTSASDLIVGESYVVGVENNTHGKRLMSDVTGSGSSTYRTWVDATDAFNSEKTTVTQSGAATAGAVVVTLLSDGNGKYAFYDISNDKYISGSSSNYLVDHSTLSDAGDNAWWTIEFADNLMSVTLNGSTRVLGYNLGSPRFSTYASYAANSTTATNGTAHPVLFKMSGSSVKTAVTSFANTSLKMNDPAYEGDITTPNCASNYSAMKSAYTALTDAQKNVFQYSDDYSAARARLNNWATANGEVFSYGSDTPFSAGRFNTLTVLSESTNTVAIIVIISMVSVTAIGGYFFLRKRKEN